MKNKYKHKKAKGGHQNHSQKPHKKNLNKKNESGGAPKGPRPTLFGFHAVAEAWLNPARNIEVLYATTQGKNSFADIIQEAQSNGLKRPAIITVEKDKLDKMLPKGAVHQGLALVANSLQDYFLQDLIIKSEAKNDALVLMLDQVTDPHNVGAILRSACAFGVDAVIMQKKHAPELTGVLAKTACGAIEHVSVIYETNLSRALDELKDNHFFAYGLDERGEQDIGEIKSGGKSVLVLGAEGPGLRRLVSEHCDSLVRLPMHGPMPSINVSNAAAVALYALSSHF